MADQDVEMKFEDLRSLLEPMISECLEAHGGAAEPGTGDTGPDTAPIFDTLNRLVRQYAERPPSSKVTGIPLPEVDAELLPLQGEIEVILQRLSNYRKAVPEVMSSAMQQQLAQLRPQLDASRSPGLAVAPVEGQTTPEAEAGRVQQLQQLHDTMTSALARLPGLRARLEAVEARLSRNMAAVVESQQQQQQSQARTPCTVEKVMREAAGLAGTEFGA